MVDPVLIWGGRRAKIREMALRGTLSLSFLDPRTEGGPRDTEPVQPPEAGKGEKIGSTLEHPGRKTAPRAPLRTLLIN